MDALSVWAHWCRYPLFPISIDTEPFKRRGWVYELCSPPDFEPPDEDLREVMSALLQEAWVLKSGVIPPLAVVEVNFPPFTHIVFDEADTHLVFAEAYDADGKGLPMYIWPGHRRVDLPDIGSLHEFARKRGYGA